MAKSIASQENLRKAVLRSIALQSHNWKDVVEGVRSPSITESCILRLSEL